MQRAGLSLGCVKPTLQAWRGATKNNGALRHLRAANSNVAPVIPRHLILLIACVMLFIDDDQSELPISNRRKHGTARAHHQAHVPRRHQVPMLISLRGSESTMQDGDALLREACHQSAAGLRCQTDLRHQHQRRASRGQGALNEPHVHLGLAGTGDTKQ